MKVAIVGGGVIGLTSAYHLARHGVDVTVVDARTPGRGASHGNAGWVVPADVGPVPAPGMVRQGLRWMLRPDSPLYVRPSLDPQLARFMLTMARHCNRRDFRAGMRANLRLGERTIALLDEYRRDGVAFEMHEQGLLMAFATAAEFEAHCHDLDLIGEFGRTPKTLTGSEITEREPALQPGLHAALFFPDERHVRPDTLMTGLVNRCRELGVDIRAQTPVVSLRHDNDRIGAIELADGTLTADAFLLAAGAHSGGLSRTFGVPLPVRAGKGYSLDYAPPPVQVTSTILLAETKVALTPLDGALRLAGTMEFARLDTVVNDVRVAAIRRAPQRYVKHWDDPAPTTAPWAGARPMTPDGLPIIGRLPGLANGYVATGHGMLGITLGPATGELIAQTIVTGKVPDVLAPFDPRRYARGVSSRTRPRRYGSRRRAWRSPP